MDLVPAQIASEWNSAAESYADMFESATAKIGAKVLDDLGVKAGESFIDVAAGSGATAIPAAKLGAQVTAIDFSEAMIGLLVKNSETAGVEVTALVMDGQNLDFPDRIFDVAVSAFGLTFFPDLAAGFGELHRVVKSGGRVAVCADALAPDDPFARLVGKALVTVIPALADAPDEVGVGARLAQPGALEKYFADAGFENIETKIFTTAIPIEDPVQFWLKMGSSLPPIKPLFDAFDRETMEKVAKAFAQALADDNVDGVPTIEIGTLVGIATKADS